MAVQRTRVTTVAIVTRSLMELQWFIVLSPSLSHSL
jgi:hypothetical protein